MKILFVSSEVEPFSKTGGLADVVGSLPKYLAGLGAEVKIVTPRYAICRKNPLEQKPLPGTVTIKIGDSQEVARFYSSRLGPVEVWLVDNNKFFDRPELYQEKGQDYPDNAERFIFFNLAVLEYLKKTGWKPDIIHCHDWQSGLIPVYLKATYKNDEFFKKCKTIYTIHNLAYQGVFDKHKILLTGLGWEYFTFDKLEYWDQLCLAKGGLVFADKVTTVSARYSREIQEPEFGCGLDGVLRSRSRDVVGIINGIDYEYWNPATDPDIYRNFRIKNLSPKADDKKNLQKTYGLPEDEVPLLSIISRLADQKGFDILSQIVPALMRMKIQLVILGTGEPKYHDLFSKMAKKFPKKLGLALKFDSPLSRKIYAGSDFFLMPSRYEPCGLGQMIALRYATIPVVRATGGLADTIENYNPNNGEGNGFVFKDYKPAAFLEAIKNGLKIYKNSRLWPKLLVRAMSYDFSWEASARQYLKLYENLLKKK